MGKQDLVAFCNRDAVDVARDLLGMVLCVDGVGGAIVETEAYRADDPASHSFRGMTASNAAMFGPPATAYVYRIYGLHNCMNVVCARAGAVLIRALRPEFGIARMVERRGLTSELRLCRGPGNICAALGVDSSLNGLPLDRPPFSLEPGSGAVASILAGPRIGISRNADVPWRFAPAGSQHVSRPFPRMPSGNAANQHEDDVR